MPDGYLRKCTHCGKRIYMKPDFDGQWKPYESWVGGTVDENEWVLHACTTSNTAPARPHGPVPQPPARPEPNPPATPATAQAGPAECQAEDEEHPVGRVLDNLMYWGLSLQQSLDLLSKAASIQNTISEIEMNPLPMVTDIFEALSQQQANFYTGDDEANAGKTGGSPDEDIPF